MNSGASIAKSPSAGESGWIEEVKHSITNAHQAASRGQTTDAVRWFDLCRAQLSSLAPPSALQRHVKAHFAGTRREAERVRSALLEQSAPDAETRIAIFGDSLGLPRPEEMADFSKALAGTYPSLILSKMREVGSFGGVRVDSHCERYLSTNDLVVLLQERPETIADAHILVHLGLNDCAVRMFMTEQRLALNLLPPEVSEDILNFSRKYRNDLVRAFPDFCFVPLERYRSNLHRIAILAQVARCKSLTFCTIIVTPLKFWTGTPGICQNFSRYNLAIMSSAQEMGAQTLDVDRLMWEANTTTSLNPDGMHLSSLGHDILASACLKTVFGL
jgi:hypothetical protein